MHQEHEKERKQERTGSFRNPGVYSTHLEICRCCLELRNPTKIEPLCAFEFLHAHAAACRHRAWKTNRSSCRCRCRILVGAEEEETESETEKKKKSGIRAEQQWKGEERFLGISKKTEFNTEEEIIKRRRFWWGNSRGEERVFMEDGRARGDWDHGTRFFFLFLFSFFFWLRLLGIGALRGHGPTTLQEFQPFFDQFRWNASKKMGRVKEKENLGCTGGLLICVLWGIIFIKNNICHVKSGSFDVRIIYDIIHRVILVLDGWLYGFVS